MTISNLTPHVLRPCDRIEQPHGDYGRKLRATLIASKTPPDQWPYASQHARRIFNLATSLTNRPGLNTKRSMETSRATKTCTSSVPPCHQDLPEAHDPPTRGIRRRWFGNAGDNGRSVLISIKCITNAGTLKTKDVCSRDVRFLDATAPDDQDTTDAGDRDCRPEGERPHLRRSHRCTRPYTVLGPPH